MTKSSKPPFHESVTSYKKLYGSDFRDAMGSVQRFYTNFKSRNQKLMERQIDQSNSAQIQLISHFATLAALTITMLGLFITFSGKTLTHYQQMAMLTIIVLEVISIIFGALDYIQTGTFHLKWAKVYQDIDIEVEKQINNSTMQRTEQLNAIEAKHLKNAPESTKKWITHAMIVSCIFGLSLMVALFYAYLYDVPILM